MHFRNFRILIPPAAGHATHYKIHWQARNYPCWKNVAPLSKHGPKPESRGPSTPSRVRAQMVCRDAGSGQTCPQEAMDEHKEPLVVMQKQVSAVAETTKREAEEIDNSDQLISALQQSRDELMKLGALAPATALSNEIRKEERRRRAMCKENPAVMEAMKLQREFEARQETERKRLVDETNKRMLANKREELNRVEQLVRKRKADLLELENIAATRAVVKNIRPRFWAKTAAVAAVFMAGSFVSKFWTGWPSLALVCRRNKGVIGSGSKNLGITKCWKSGAWTGVASSLIGSKAS